MVTLQTIQMWSDQVQAVVDWTVAPLTETDPGGNISTVITLTYNDEVLRFSPNYTDEELQAYVSDINNQH